MGMIGWPLGRIITELPYTYIGIVLCVCRFGLQIQFSTHFNAISMIPTLESDVCMKRQEYTF